MTLHTFYGIYIVGMLLAAFIEPFINDKFFNSFLCEDDGDRFLFCMLWPFMLLMLILIICNNLGRKLFIKED